MTQFIGTVSACLTRPRDAAEDFLLARYRLYTNVYLHKTTRGIEQLLSTIICRTAEIVESGDTGLLGISGENQLIRFLSPGGETLDNYLALDDTVVWAVIGRLRSCGDGRLAQLATRLWLRQTPATIDIQTEFPNDSERQRRAQHRLDDMFKDAFGADVFKDDAKLNLYGEIGADDAKAQQRLMIQLRNGDVREISTFSDATIAASDRGRRFLRYYFLSESDYNRARSAIEGR